MTFSKAMELLMLGYKLYCSSWNDKQQYIELGYVSQYDDAFGTPIDCDCRVIVFHGTKGIQIGWLASQGDMLDCNWCVKED